MDNRQPWGGQAETERMKVDLPALGMPSKTYIGKHL